MELTSRRHPYKFYLLIVLINLLFLGIGSIFISASIRDNNNIGLFIFIIFVIICMYFDFIMITNSYKIVLNKKGILHKNEFYEWSNIKNISLTGKSELFLNTPTECASLTFKNLKTIKIFDNIYSNSDELKCFIKDIVVDKKERYEVEIEKNNTSNLKNEFFIPYKGHPIFSFRGLFMWVFILAFFIIPFVSSKPIKMDKYLNISIIPIFWFFFNSWMLFYFEVSKNYFVVKNHYFFWINDVYKIGDIHEVVFERQGKQPNSLKIITKRFKTKLYSAGSLTDSKWLELKKELEKGGVKVRNECI